MIENNTSPQSGIALHRRQVSVWCLTGLLILVSLLGSSSQAQAQSALLQWWPLKATALDSTAVRSAYVTANSETLHNFVVSNGTTVPTVKAYSALYGQAFGSSADGTSSPTPGGTLNRTYYAQVRVTAAAGSSVRVDSVVFWAAFYNTTSTNHKLAVAWSRSNFVSDSTEAAGGTGPVGPLTTRSTTPGTGTGSFADPILPRNQNTGANQYYRLPLGAGQTLATGQTLTIRFYYATGSSSSGRYMLLRDVQAKGAANATSGGCAAPTGAAVGSITATTAQLTFTPGASNTAYTVTYTPQGGSATTVTPAPTASPINLTGLTAGTTYSLTLQSLCGSTASGTTTLSFTTPLAAGASAVLQHYPLKLNAQDSAAIRSPAVTASVATLTRLQLADGSNATVTQPYSPKFGQAVGVAANGSWATSSGAPVTVANPDRRYYEQYTVTAAAGRSVRVDSLLLTAATYNSANGRLAIVYSLTNFTTADSTNIPVGGRVTPGGTLPAANYGAFGSPILLANQTAGPSNVYHLAFSGSTGLTLAAGQMLTVRLYPGVGSTSAGRYVTIKDVVFKGATLGAAPCNAAFAYSTSSYCQSGTNPTPTITGTAGGTFTSTTGLSLSANTGAINLAASTPGLYTVTYTTSATCSSTASVTITAAPTATFSYGSASYCAGAVATPSPTITSGSTSGTFSSTTGLSINASTGAINLAASTAATYTVTNTVAASNGCAAVTATFVVTINPATAATFSYGTSSYCTSSSNPTPTVTGTAGGSFSSTTGLSLTAATGAINLAASTPGTYTVTYSVAGNCPSSSTASVTITVPGQAAFSYPATSYCSSTTGAIAATLGSGSSAGTFTSTTGLTLNASTGAITPSTSTGGTYIVTNTLAASGGCAAVTSTATVTINPATSASFAYGANTYCLSGTNPTPTVTGTGGGTFTSTGGLSLSSTTGALNLAASTSGTYVVTYSVAGPCPSSSTATVTLSTAPTATFSYANTAYCLGSTTNLTPTVASSSASGVFSSTTGLVINSSTGAIDLTTSTAGTYTVTNTVAANGGCAAATATFTLTLNPATSAAFTYGAGTYCLSGANPTVNVTGTSGGVFSSTAGLSLDAASGAINLATSSTGTYTVTYSVAGPCPSSSTATITLTNAPTASFSYANPAYCAGAGTAPTPTIAAGSTGGTFSSTTGLSIDATTGAINLATSTPGTYTVTNSVTASGGCAASSAITTVTINAPTTASFSYANASFCQSGTDPSPTVTGTAGGSFGSTLGLSIAANGQISLATSTPGTYTVTYSVAGPCPSSSTASVTISAPATAAFTYPAATYCTSTTGTIAATPATGSTAGTFSSTTGLTLDAGTGAITPGTSTAGTYTVTNTVAASGACAAVSATTTVTITNALSAAFSYPNTAYCSGAGTTPTPTVATGSTAGTYSSTTGLSIDATTGAITLATSTAGIYTVTNSVAASGACAAATATTTITINATPAQPTISVQYNGTTTTLTSSAATGNQFFLNGNPVTGATGQTYVVTGAAQFGAYTVVVTGVTGCASVASAPLTVTASRTALPGTSLTVYPNPTPDGQLTVQLIGYHQATELTLINALGQVILTRAVPQSSTGETSLSFDLSQFATGVYMLRAITAGGVDTRRVMVR